MALTYQNIAMKEKVIGNYLANIVFILSGEAHTTLMKQLQTQKTKGPTSLPLTSNKQYKLLTQKNKFPQQYSTPGTTEEGHLQKQTLKRIREDQETDTDFQTDAVLQSPKKKKVKYTRQLQYIPPEEEEIQESLLELCKESTYQETQDPQTLYHLIQQQQHQQRDIKLHLLKLISDIKKKQCMLQLQTGMLN